MIVITTTRGFKVLGAGFKVQGFGDSGSASRGSGSAAPYHILRYKVVFIIYYSII